MVCLQRRREANRANALRSTGPKTEAGKARSRANAFQHGMTGAGVVLPAGAEAAVEATSAGLRRAFASEALSRRLAVLSDRLERLDRRDRADTAVRVRRAGIDAVERRQSDMDALVERLEVEPDVAVRRLQMTVEGCDRLIVLWEGLAEGLERPRGWSDADRALAERLTGRKSGAQGASRLEILATIARGDARHLPADEPLDDPAYREAIADKARQALGDLVADHLGRIEDHRATLPAADPETEAAEAADLALFDESKRGDLFRRYELTTERHLFRTLLELERLDEAVEPLNIPEPPRVPVASFGEEATPPEVEPCPTPSEPEAPAAGGSREDHRPPVGRAPRQRAGTSRIEEVVPERGGQIESLRHQGRGVGRGLSP